MSGKKERSTAMHSILARSTQKKSRAPPSGSKYTSVRNRSRSKSMLDRSLGDEPLSLMSRFDLVAASGRKAPLPLVSLHQAMVSQALTAEVLIRGKCMVKCKLEELAALEADIRKLKKTVAVQRSQKENKSGVLKETIKECKKLGDKLEKKIGTVESVVKKKRTTLSTTESRIQKEDQRYDTIATGQSKLEAEISMLLSNAANTLPVDRTGSVEVLVESEIARKNQNEVDLGKLTSEKKQLAKTVRHLETLIQEVEACNFSSKAWIKNWR